MKKQVFLGGACGRTTWRRDIAIPALEAAGITYFDPQLGVGEWTEACEAAEMKAKAEADALLFVINGETRGVAGVAEVAYLIAARRPLALALRDVTEGTLIDHRIVDPMERDDLNRGRIFIRTMAACHGVPVFEQVEDAVRYAIDLVNKSRQSLTLSEIRSILIDVRYKEYEFLVDQTEDGFQLQLRCEAEDIHSGAQSVQKGRKWYISQSACRSDVVQTAFKAVVTWQEHEAREHFRYQGTQIFGPHYNVDSLVELLRSTNGEKTEQIETSK